MAGRLILSVIAKDFITQTFSVGGHGDGGKDTSNSGVRLIHRASGAVGEGREHRSNTLNKRSAFEKLVKTKKFLNWHKAAISRARNLPVPETPEEIRARVDRMVDEGLKDGSIKVEVGDEALA